jgi:hypothetical protein
LSSWRAGSSARQLDLRRLGSAPAALHDLVRRERDRTH